MWDGVYIESDPSTPQASPYTDKGWLTMIRSTIKHARIALTPDTREYETALYDNDQTPYAPTSDFAYTKWVFKHPRFHTFFRRGGALMTVSDSHFIDNDRDIEFMSYDRYKNNSAFSNTEFINEYHMPLLINIDHDWDWISSKDHVTIWENHGIQFKGCDFKGIDYPTGILNKRSRGIYSLSSEFMVYPLCTSLDIPCSVFKRSSFERLSAAVSASPVSNAVGKPLVIVDADFGRSVSNGDITVPNLQNIYVNGTADAGTYINRNRIAVSDKTADGIVCDPPGTCGTYRPFPFGIDIEYTTSFMMEENDIIGDVTDEGNANFGIVIDSTGGYDNTVYLNNIDYLNHNAVSLNYNWDGNQYGPGLFWQCNSFGSYSTDAIEVLSQDERSYPPYTTSGGPLLGSNHKYFQGAVSTTDLSLAANNRFYMSCVSSSDNKLFADPDAGYNPGSQIYEYAHNSNAVFDPTGCISTGIVLNSTFTSVSEFESVCPSRLPREYGTGDDDEDDWEARMQGTQTQKEIIQDLLAEGDEQQLMDYISDPGVGSALMKQYLEQAGPYLSDRVLKATMERVNSPLTNSDLATVVIDNSPLKDSVYDVLDNTRPTVGGNYYVVQAQYADRSPRAKMEIAKSQYTSEMRKAYKYGLMKYLAHDSIQYIDSAALLSLAGGYTLEAIPLLIAAGNTTLAASILTNYNAATQNEADQKAMLTIILNNKMNDVSMEQAVADNLSAVQAIASHGSTMSAQAKTLLHMYNGELESVAMRPVYSNVSNKTNTITHKKREYTIRNYSRFVDENNVSLSPNPAHDQLNIQLKLKDGIKQVALIAYNMVGQQVYRLDLPTDKQSYTLDISSWIAGQYTIKVTADGELISTHKLSVIK